MYSLLILECRSGFPEIIQLQTVQYDVSRCGFTQKVAWRGASTEYMSKPEIEECKCKHKHTYGVCTELAGDCQSTKYSVCQSCSLSLSPGITGSTSMGRIPSWVDFTRHDTEEEEGVGTDQLEHFSSTTSTEYSLLSRSQDGSVRCI